MHTPGPWKWVFIGTAGNEFLRGPNMEEVGDMPMDKSLQAASPRLFTALRNLVREVKHQHAYDGTQIPVNAVQEAEAAIAEAEKE